MEAVHDIKAIVNRYTGCIGINLPLVVNYTIFRILSHDAAAERVTADHFLICPLIPNRIFNVGSAESFRRVRHPFTRLAKQR
jgi:hypothetical protein